MSGDPAEKNRSDDASYTTIPPELRDFVPPKGAQHDLVAAGASPALVATVAALKALNGGEQTSDPFYFNTRGVATAAARRDGEGEDEAKGAGNAKVHVPAFALPTMAKNDAAEDAEITVEKVGATGSAAAVVSETPTAIETASSPWASEAAVAPIASSELPSALAPVARTEPAPASEKAAGVPLKDDRLVRAGIAVVVVAVLGFAAFQLVPQGKTTPQGAAVPVPSAVVSAGTVAAARPVVSAAVPDVAADVDAGAAVTPTANPVLPVPVKVKRPGTPEENIYDAAPPGPAKTVEAAVPPPPTATVPVVAPATATPKASSGPTPMFERGN
jgi:hypothetical protein